MFRDVFELWYRVTFDNIERTIEGCSDDVWLKSMWSVADDPAKPHAVAPDGSDHPLGDEVLSAVWKMVWHGLGANEFNLYGRPPGFRSSFAPEDPSWVATQAFGSGSPSGEVVSVEPASREEMLAYPAGDPAAGDPVSEVGRRDACQRVTGDHEQARLIGRPRVR